MLCPKFPELKDDEILHLRDKNHDLGFTPLHIFGFKRFALWAEFGWWWDTIRCTHRIKEPIQWEEGSSFWEGERFLIRILSRKEAETGKFRLETTPAMFAEWLQSRDGKKWGTAEECLEGVGPFLGIQEKPLWTYTMPTWENHQNHKVLRECSARVRSPPPGRDRLTRITSASLTVSWASGALMSSGT
jgi:hypothetical protein